MRLVANSPTRASEPRTEMTRPKVDWSEGFDLAGDPMGSMSSFSAPLAAQTVKLNVLDKLKLAVP